jgi:hypothetical protein
LTYLNPLFIRDWCWAILLIFYFLAIPNASWTLKVISLVNIFRGLNYMCKHNYKALQSKVIETNLKPIPYSIWTRYINRASNMLPSQGNKALYVSTKIIFYYKLLRLDSVKDKRIFFLKNKTSSISKHIDETILLSRYFKKSFKLQNHWSFLFTLSLSL